MKKKKLLFSFFILVSVLSIFSIIVQSAFPIKKIGIMLPLVVFMLLLIPIVIIIYSLREEPKGSEKPAKQEEQPKEKKEEKKVAIKGSDKKEPSSSLLPNLIFLIAVLSAGYFWGEDICAITKVMPPKLEQWWFCWERAYNPKNRTPEVLSAKLRADILRLDEKSMEFVIHYKDQGKDRISMAKGTRVPQEKGVIYSGTWSQGVPGDPDYDYGGWTLQFISPKKWKGETTDSHRDRCFISLEKF